MKSFLLVAGVDYMFKGVNFRNFCNNRMKRLIKANRKQEDLTFQIFDIRKGEVVTHTVAYAGGKQFDTVTRDAQFKPVTRASYTKGHQFKDGQKDIISVLDIYKAVRQIGKTTPKTLAELSFFSHAYFGGPILVNSDDDGSVQLQSSSSAASRTVQVPDGVRDPDDFDPRTKDFHAPTMNSEDLRSFQAAFRDDGYVWIWGCAFPRIVHEILHKLEHHPSYRSSGLRDDEVFKFRNFNADQVQLIESLTDTKLVRFGPGTQRIEISFGLLRSFFCGVTVACYTRHIATGANVKAFGGVMGTYSEYDSGPLPLMHVHSGFARHFTFYKNYLGFDFDSEGRHYGLYRPDFACKDPSAT